MKKTFLLLTFTSLFLSVFGQEEKIIVIDKGSGKTYRHREPKDKILVDHMSVLKFSPLQMVVGEINFGFEKKIDEMSSIEFELGPTLSNIGFTVNDNHYYDPFGNYSAETSKIGVFVGVGYRFYPMDDSKVLNGFYVSPVFKYRLFNFGVHDYSENLKDSKGNENQLLFSFNFGYQKWLSQSFSLDFFGGVGLAYESHLHQQVATEYNSQTGYYDYYWDPNAYSGVRYLMTAGIKVGIGN